MNQLLAATPCLILIVGCASSSGGASRRPDLLEEREALMVADRAMFEAEVSSESPVDAFLTFCLDDARLLPPGAPMASGKDEIRAVMAALHELPGYSLEWSPVTAGVGGAGDLGYTIGTYRMEYRDPGGDPVVIDGKYLTVWKRQPDGGWMVAVDMFNANQAP